MNILLWVLQVIVGIYCIMGAMWRFLNYEEMGKEIASLQALSYGVWNGIGFIEVACAVGLILPGVLNMNSLLTPVAAILLAVEMLMLTCFHANFYGLTMAPTNPAMWTLMLSILSGFIAYGRYKLHPL